MDSQSYAQKLQQGQTTLRASLIRFKSGNGVFGSLVLLITPWKLEMHWISWILVIQLIHCTGITAKWKDQSSMKGKLALQWAAKELAAKMLFLKCRLTLRSKQCCAQFCSISCNHICMDFPNICYFLCLVDVNEGHRAATHNNIHQMCPLTSVISSQSTAGFYFIAGSSWGENLT